MSTSFQELILRLHTFWSGQGCLIWQPYSEKVGAGTMNPATVLNVVGPEPWNVAYVEPSYRPDDGRFGENPNRMQMHTQYQVILKPDPGNPQEMYLDSLRAIGIDTDQHDIRFVEDNWESPALGAWGLGWEVWLDGMEITQFTYFQQSASQVLDQPAVEITYGLERIAMFLQGVRQVWDINWDGRHKYGEVLLLPEIDHCRYDFEVADIDRLLQMYGLFEEEARNALAAGLVVPAHDYVLRCSHTFNVLDARGAIGVTERAGYFAKMRELARKVAEAYLAQREEKGFPLMDKMPAFEAPSMPDLPTPLSEPRDFVLEVGVEELPPHELQFALEQWRGMVPKALDEARLDYDGIVVHGTPRRLCAYVNGLRPGQPDREVELKGPPADRAFDAEGKPTKAGEGFARSNGIPVESLEVHTDGKKSYVVAKKKEVGRSSFEVLSEVLGGLVTGLRFAKTMRWDLSKAAFSRPVRWLLALHGDQVVPFGYAHLVSGRTTRGPRPLGSPEVSLGQASEYFKALEQMHVIVDRQARQEAIHKMVAERAKEAGGEVPAGQEGLLDEVTDLVEWPVAVLGRFEEQRLALPSSVLITVMKKHQRYFPVVKPGTQELLPCFVAVSNGQRGDMSLVRQGNEDVLRARYADADYFVRSDREQKLADYVPALEGLTFQEKLGSMGQKQARIEKLTRWLADQLKLGQDEKAQALRAAGLCKADLVTSMVVEMTSLQGVLGEVYALDSGEQPGVARAIREHYLPKSSGDDLPQETPGTVVGLADRLDSLAGLFAVGLKPTGSADPYGLRRTALGLVNLMVGKKLAFSLDQALAEAAALQPVPCDQQTVADALTFTMDRLSVWLKEQGFRHDVVEAAVAGCGANPAKAHRTAEALAEVVSSEDWEAVFTAYARCKRITRDLTESYPLAPAHYNEPSTKNLHQAIEKVLASTNGGRDVAGLVAVLKDLQPKIDSFFDEVLVMAKEDDLRQARLALVQRVAGLPDGVADLTRLEGF
ncbi:MAG: glycine--tRNA ligase subunit beta [Vulcanimicrobiota bacterium]